MLERLRRGKRSEPAKRRQERERDHRNVIGGYWEPLGKLQLEFLVGQGLEPSARFLDVGCGALRVGHLLVDYLDAGNYYGIDHDAFVLEAGYEKELTPEQRLKLPRENLRLTERFEVDFGVPFDMGIAQSVFTHVSLNHVRLCLRRVAAQMRVGGRFFVTISEAPADFELERVLNEDVPEKPERYTERNPFWYWPSDIEWAAGFSPWRYRYIGDWGHPRDQKMIELTRTE
jgi:SAM-dependent methyltransferase